jgi:hypothetical protein
MIMKYSTDQCFNTEAICLGKASTRRPYRGWERTLPPGFGHSLHRLHSTNHNLSLLVDSSSQHILPSSLPEGLYSFNGKPSLVRMAAHSLLLDDKRYRADSLGGD